MTPAQDLAGAQDLLRGVIARLPEAEAELVIDTSSAAWQTLHDAGYPFFAALKAEARRLCGPLAAKAIDACITEKSAPAAGWPEPLDLELLAEREPQQPRFIVPDWMPCGYATLLAGHGGVGKSGIALHLAVCAAAECSFFGQTVERCRVLYLSCEDRQNILHWRLARICSHLGLDLASLRGWLDVMDLVGRDTVLWERDPRTGYTVTPAFGRLAAHMSEHQPDLLIVDGISDTYAGSGGSKTEVKRFVNALVSLIPPETGAVLLVGHIDKKAAKEGAGTEGYDGTTGWHNAVRARWYLYPETASGDDSDRFERTGDLVLELQKSNLGRIDQSMRFRWDDNAHMFLGESIGGTSTFDRKHRDRTDRDGILAAFRACAAAVPPIVIPAAMTGPRTTYHVLSARPEFPETLRSGKPSVRRFWRQIEELRAMNVVTESSIRRSDRHYIRQLELTQDGLRACGE